jgi:hypothetical protein
MNTLAATTWSDMYSLRALPPLGIFPSVVNAVQSFHIPILAMIATNNIRLGGQFSPLLLAPTPIGLVPQNVLHMPLEAPPHPLPPGVRATAEAAYGPNWAQTTNHCPAASGQEQAEHRTPRGSTARLHD